MSYGNQMWVGPKGLVSGKRATGRFALAQSLAARLETSQGEVREIPNDELGALAEALDYGQDLSEYVGAVGYSTAVNAIPGLVRAELLKDDRVIDVSVDATIATDTAGLMRITMVVDVLPEDEDASFPLTFSVSDATITLLGVG